MTSKRNFLVRKGNFLVQKKIKNEKKTKLVKNKLKKVLFVLNIVAIMSNIQLLISG